MMKKSAGIATFATRSIPAPIPPDTIRIVIAMKSSCVARLPCPSETAPKCAPGSAVNPTKKASKA